MKHLLFFQAIATLVLAVPAVLFIAPIRLLAVAGGTFLVGALANTAILTGQARGGDAIITRYGLALLGKAIWLGLLIWGLKDQPGHGAAEIILAILLLVVYHLGTARLLLRGARAENP
jgi:hypothetical protein